MGSRDIGQNVEETAREADGIVLNIVLKTFKLLGFEKLGLEVTGKLG